MVKYAKYLILMFLLCNLISTLRGEAATIQATSCSRSDVSSAISSANDGDTVLIPAGSCSWNSAITLPTNKGIHLQGAGVGKTLITDNSGSQAINVQTVDKGWSISHIEFNGDSNYWGAIHVTGRNNQFRIHHCKFDTFYNGRSIVIDGWQNDVEIYGVIDNCEFINGYQSVLVFGDHDYSWSRPHSLGTGKNVFVEDCSFTNAPYLIEDAPLDSGRGARTVFRHNSVTNGFISSHGICRSTNTRSYFSMEVYNNEWVADNHPIWMVVEICGGTGVFFNNTFIERNGGTMNMPLGVHYLRSCSNVQCTWCGLCDGDDPIDANDDATGWRCKDQPGVGTNQKTEPLYEWDNTLNGNDVHFHLRGGCVAEGNHLKENRDFYNDTKRPGYTPYTYPHPLRTNGDTTPPSPPINPRLL